MAECQPTGRNRRRRMTWDTFFYVLIYGIPTDVYGALTFCPSIYIFFFLFFILFCGAYRKIRVIDKKKRSTFFLFLFYLLSTCMRMYLAKYIYTCVVPIVK